MNAKAGLHSHRALAPELREVDMRLRGWADWARTGRLNIGWPRVSITGKMVEWRRLGIRPDPGLPPPVAIPEEIAVVDALIAKLPEKQRRVILIHYSKDDPIEIKIRLAKLSAGSYRRFLDVGRWSIRLGLLTK